MEVDSAIDLINSLIYKPGWRISAKDHQGRFEGTVAVKIDYPAQNTNRDQAPDYPENIETYASFPLVVGDCDDECLYRRVLDEIMKIELHEAREYLRVQPTLWAPFHPHRIDGMKRWGELEADLRFGVC